jgi:hypothetical protein
MTTKPSRRRIRYAFAVSTVLVLASLSGVTAASGKPDCDVPNPPPACDPGSKPPKAKGNPIGHVDRVASTSKGLHITGWAIDPDTAAAIDVQILVDGKQVRGATANTDRPDVGAAHPGFGNAHGFDAVLHPRRHTSVCVVAVNSGPGADRQLGCAREERAVSVLDLNIAGLGEKWRNDSGQGETTIAWRDRYRRVAQWMSRTGTLPDIIALQEMPVLKRWVTVLPDPFDPDPYEAHALLIGHIKALTGANYRIAYASTDSVAEGLNHLYQGRTLIYNADRLRNTTATVATSPPVPDSDTSRVGVQTRSSLPCFFSDRTTCALIDGDGRHWVEAHINSLNGRWTRGPAAATFELKAYPGNHILIINGHQHPQNPQRTEGDPEDAPGLRALVNATWAALQPYQKLIAPIIAADFNGDPELLPDFETANAAGVDFILLGKREQYPAALSPVREGEIMPSSSPGPEWPHCGSIGTLLSDHCAVFVQFIHAPGGKRR